MIGNISYTSSIVVQFQYDAQYTTCQSPYLTIHDIKHPLPLKNTPNPTPLPDIHTHMHATIIAEAATTVEPSSEQGDSKIAKLNGPTFNLR